MKEKAKKKKQSNKVKAEDRQGGRRTLEIDWKKVEEMLKGGANGNQVARTIGIHSATLYRRVTEEFDITYQEYLQKLKASGDTCLLLKQYEKAISGNITMLIWLGKQRLGQKDHPADETAFNGKLAELLDIMLDKKKLEDNAKENNVLLSEKTEG